MVLLDAGGAGDGAWYPFPIKGVAPEDRPQFKVRRVSPQRQKELLRKHYGQTQRLRRRRVRDEETGKKVVVTEEQVNMDRSVEFAKALAAEALVASRGLEMRPTSEWAAAEFSRALKRQVTLGEELKLDDFIGDDAVKGVVFDLVPDIRDFVFEKAEAQGEVLLEADDDPETAAGKT